MYLVLWCGGAWSFLIVFARFHAHSRGCLAFPATLYFTGLKCVWHGISAFNVTASWSNSSLAGILFVFDLLSGWTHNRHGSSGSSFPLVSDIQTGATWSLCDPYLSQVGGGHEAEYIRNALLLEYYHQYVGKSCYRTLERSHPFISLWATLQSIRVCERFFCSSTFQAKLVTFFFHWWHNFFIQLIGV